MVYSEQTKVSDRFTFSKLISMIKSWWKRNISVAGFGLDHDEPRLFYTSQYDIPQLFLVFRILIATYACHVFILIMYDFHYKTFIFLTNWTYTLQVITLIYECFLAFLYMQRVRCRKNDQATVMSMKWHFKVEWVLHNVTTAFPILVTLTYWTVIYKPKPDTKLLKEYVNFQVHACNSIIAILNCLLSAIPVRVLHFVHPLFYGLIYLFFSAVYYGFGGLSTTGKKYIYDILNWDRPGITIAMGLGILILLFFIHQVVFVVKCLQMKAARRWKYVKYELPEAGRSQEQEYPNEGTSNIAFTTTEVDSMWTPQLTADLGPPDAFLHSGVTIKNRPIISP